MGSNVQRETTTFAHGRAPGRSFVEIPDVRIRVHPPNGVAVDHNLGLKPITVGSSSECDISIHDGSVSRLHCQLLLTPQGVSIKDAGSKNGMFAHGIRVMEALLAPGDSILIGGSTIAVLGSGARTEIPLLDEPRFGEALGASVAMRALFAQLARAADSAESILLIGESGTGKELLARAIHDRSPRRDHAFMVLDCATIAPSLIEAELFGHAKGAFTGADAARTGLFEEAHEGTLFIDEIGELPLELQPRLLRALESREVRPLGGASYRRVDARIVAATHRNLRSLVSKKAFREDLYYRVAVIEANIPPLRDHKDDIALLVEHFLETQNPPRGLSDLPANALDLLSAHDWPGNIRELRNVVARLVLFPQVGKDAIHGAGQGERPFELGHVLRLGLREARDAVVSDFERRYLEAKLTEHKGNVSKAAQAMGVSRQFAHRLLARYGIASGSNDGD
jgi:transcriptional regulator with PAS, ATPase and Fis domain